MTTPKNDKVERPCEACHGRGWLLMFNTDRRVSEIQRCDACDRYASDEEAGEAAAPIIEAALALTDLAVGNAVAKVRRRRRPSRSIRTCTCFAGTRSFARGCCR